VELFADSNTRVCLCILAISRFRLNWQGFQNLTRADILS